MTPLLHIDRVTVVRSVPGCSVRILDELSLQIPQGCHTAILGPNGSGKTSLLKLLNRQFYPSVDAGHTGTVEIFGQQRWHIDELRKRLGIVSGELDREFSLPRSGRMTALQAVLSGFDGVQLITFTEQHDSGRVDQAHAALAQVAGEHLAQRTLMTLSTGERRRVLIARALVHQPQALVLDEPTSGLDIAASATFMRHVRRLAQSGITIILVTHHIEEIIPEINNVILLKHGKVFSQGNGESQLTAAKLSALFGIAVDVQQNAAGIRLLTATVNPSHALQTVSKPG